MNWIIELHTTTIEFDYHHYHSLSETLDLGESGQSRHTWEFKTPFTPFPESIWMKDI